MRIDYIRYRSVSELLAAGASPEFGSADAAYRSSSSTWYFQTPSSSSWRDAQLYAFTRGGNLATMESAEANTRLQGKFTGEFWLGYYRDFVASPLRWVGGSVATYANWFSGQPGATADQI
ncbi:MAG: C-type lectin domain-containing protein [Verrucomicrobia bacterium]|nr:C-type lectin domain-containing protein [Verrucomicrobiota bacterium]